MNQETVKYAGKWHFTMVENGLLRNTELSFQARFLWILLKSYTSPDSPVPFPGFETLAHYMSSCRKNWTTGEIESKPMDEDTQRKYRQELVDKGFLVVERVRDGKNRWLKNQYVLLDGPDGPHRENPGLGKSRPRKIQATENPGIKKSHSFKENPIKRRTSSSNSAPKARAAADVSPLADFSDQTSKTPAPQNHAGPRGKAESFIEIYREWAKKFQSVPTVVPAERETAVAFFSENTDMTPRHLGAIMLAAWMMDVNAVTKGTSNHKSHWYCAYKSRRIGTFLKFLPNVQDDLEWKGTQEQIERVYQCASARHVKNTSV